MPARVPTATMSATLDHELALSAALHEHAQSQQNDRPACLHRHQAGQPQRAAALDHHVQRRLQDRRERRRYPQCPDDPGRRKCSGNARPAKHAVAKLHSRVSPRMSRIQYPAALIR